MGESRDTKQNIEKNDGTFLAQVHFTRQYLIICSNACTNEIEVARLRIQLSHISWSSLCDVMGCGRCNFSITNTLLLMFADVCANSVCLCAFFVYFGNATAAAGRIGRMCTAAYLYNNICVSACVTQSDSYLHAPSVPLLYHKRARGPAASVQCLVFAVRISPISSALSAIGT